jgi:hypothetical protein
MRCLPPDATPADGYLIINFRNWVSKSMMTTRLTSKVRFLLHPTMCVFLILQYYSELANYSEHILYTCTYSSTPKYKITGSLFGYLSPSREQALSRLYCLRNNELRRLA